MLINKTAVITGAGVSGLICAAILVKNNIKTDLYDRMDSPGRKFLLAGMSGLNLTNIEEIDSFASHYWGNEKVFKKLLEKYSPQDFISFLKELGIETFTGSSGKVFPVSMKGEETVQKILEYLDNSFLFSFHGKHNLIEIDEYNNLVFEKRITNHDISADKNDFIKEKTDTAVIKVSPAAAVFALGGGSRKNTGSDGKWTGVFKRKGIKTVPFEPANCGFEVRWSDSFKEYLESSVPLKNISVSCGPVFSRNEILLTGYGVEGSGIYFLSREIRERLKSAGKNQENFYENNNGSKSGDSDSCISKSECGNCSVLIDILPDLTIENIRKKLEKPRGKNSLSNYLRKTLSVNQVKFRLLKELLSKEEFVSLKDNPGIFKNLKLCISGIRPLEEAISSAGGISLDELDENMMLKKIPGFYAAGEMTDWEAPTGGYLMQGCFSTATAAATDIIKKNNQKERYFVK